LIEGFKAQQQTISHQNDTIKYFFSTQAKHASIMIFNMQGVLQKRYELPATNGEGVLVVSANEFQAGMYLYSLIINGQEVSTKKMILSE